MSSHKPIIEVKDLVKRYNKADKNAVDTISFNVNEGEFFSLLGPNGAGKTTTISILTTTLAKTSGTLKVAGFDVDDNQSQVRQSIGVIFQNPSLDLNLTAEENVRFHCFLYGLYQFRPGFSLMPKEYQDRVHDLASVLGIEKDIFKPLRTFSGGMKRKLEILRGLMHKPKVLFLDEPTIGLDPISRKNLWEYLRSVREESKTTVFLTTHYLEEAEEADHICIIDHGKIISFGTPAEIKETLVEEYVSLSTDHSDKLRAELHHKKIKFSENGVFRIDLKDNKIQELIKSIDTPLTLIKTHIPTLEEAYLHIVENYDATQS